MSLEMFLVTTIPKLSTRHVPSWTEWEIEFCFPNWPAAHSLRASLPIVMNCPALPRIGNPPTLASSSLIAIGVRRDFPGFSVETLRGKRRSVNAVAGDESTIIICVFG
eukprot:10655789-Heterocapsa_arctica.AAC.2